MKEKRKITGELDWRLHNTTGASGRTILSRSYPRWRIIPNPHKHSANSTLYDNVDMLNAETSATRDEDAIFSRQTSEPSDVSNPAAGQN
jgi:hypothetical protein